MTTTPNHDERSKIRRSDREIKDEGGILALLNIAKVCFIATSIDDQPFINSNLFWFDETQRRIYFHTAKEGRTRTNIEANPRVCFSIAEIGDLLPAKTAIEFSNEYRGVTVFGTARVVVEEDEGRHGLNGLLSKYFPDLVSGKDYAAITSEELKATSVFAIDIETWSGKAKVVRE